MSMRRAEVETSHENRMHVAKVEFDEARQLADWAAIFQDLSFVLEALNRLRDLLEAEGEAADPVLLRVYWTAGLVAYIRCFASGKRFGLSESIFADIDGGVEVHRYYKALRDKHIAHSVNPFEQVDVGVILAPPSAQERKIEGIATLSLSLISTTTEGVEQLQQLAAIARKKAGEECRRRQEATSERARKLNLNEIYEMASVRTVAPGPDDASKPRE